MSFGSFFKSVELDVEKVGHVVVQGIVAAEDFFGSGTGPKKLEFVISMVQAAAKALGVDTSSITGELTAAINALVALFNAQPSGTPQPKP